MRQSKVVISFSIAGAFLAGVVASPLLSHVLPGAHAEGAPLAPAMIDLMALKHDDLARTPNPEMNNRPLVTTDNATIAVQSGNVAKHIHPKTDEIQYIIEGSGAMWLGGERKEFKPGTLIIIPKGTAHAGTIVSNGPVKALAIKIPLQPKDDVVFVQ
ncbi:cupin domain-containing protein [Noviherbaspirillum galbum]|uniref:Cupin domain-containing protein n=1 Tax=Noviherbaspirillum galbum TaxID=2709383 RepID=A0A6B3SX85_9BURK|nr:cupin domain-containing protein [Noviherbaspirillum galbum]NEX63082.1 cupin domain-containing protein [Noviherbaspirillum galbum]